MRPVTGPPKLFSPQKPVWWAGLAVSAGAGLLFYMATAQSIDNDARERFKNVARNAQSTISARVKSYTDLLRGCASLLQTNDLITRAQFHRYVEGLSLARHFPAIETINYARYITDAQRDQFEALLRAETAAEAPQAPPYTVHPVERRDAYSVLTFIEPSTPWLDKFGLDIQAKPHVAKVLMASRDSGALSTSGQPISAMAAQNRTGLGMRLPVYRSDRPLDNVDQRRAAYLGSVGIAFSVHKLVQGVLDEMPINDVRLTLVDGGTDINRRDLGTVAPTDLVLFDSAATQAGATPAPIMATPDSYTTTLPIDFNGRLWKAQFSVRKSNLNTGLNRYFPWLAMLAGFVSSMLIYALFHTLSSSRLRAIKMAKSMTKELRDSQAKLQISHQKLRRLAAHADQIKENERKRIAREIHDDLGQNLLALRIEADILASRTRERHPRLHARARSTLSQIDATIKSVRQIINDLRPTVLDLGLNAAVDWQIAEFRRRTGIVCELIENNNEICLDDHCATAFFRILQESLSNISRHAKASLVRVQLQMQGERLTMTVSDNGIGLPEGGRNKVGSFGLVGIEERINILGGSFAIASTPGGGTMITVSVPLVQPAPRLQHTPPAPALAEVS